MVTDLILTAYSCSALAPCQVWAEKYFKNPPVVLNVPAISGDSFRAKILHWARTGDAFSAALKELSIKHKNVEIGRRALITFSAGWTVADELLKFENERKKLDAYIALDGIHTAELKHFIDYATRAANTDAFMIMAHTSITPPFISAQKSNLLIYEGACKNNDENKEKPCLTGDPPAYILNSKLETPITIKLGAAGNLPPISKTWRERPQLWWSNRGNLTKLHYAGNDRPDHVLIAQHVQEQLWRYLGQYWNGEI